MAARNAIESKYPQYKQLNIIMSGVAKDIEEMNNFITRIRNISKEAVSSGISYLEVNWES